MDFSRKDYINLKNLIEKLTGTDLGDRSLFQNLAENVKLRIQTLQISNLSSYLTLLAQSSIELQRFISQVTIHTTSWFREQTHFSILNEKIVDFFDQTKTPTIRVLSIGCSTGQEAYSIALALERERRIKKCFDYEILGIDIDQISIDIAQNAVYPSIQIGQIPVKYHQQLTEGRAVNANFFTLASEIRERCRFTCASALTLPSDLHSFHIVFCRNMLIYFDKSGRAKVFDQINGVLKGRGYLFVGHCESTPGEYAHYFSTIGNSVYKSKKPSDSENERQSKTVLIIDDADFVLKQMERLFSSNGYRVLLATSLTTAEKIIEKNYIDIISLDLHLGDCNGAEWLREMRANGNNTPTVIVSENFRKSGAKVISMLGGGAQDYIEKRQLTLNSKDIIDRFNALLSFKKDRTKPRFNQNKTKKDTAEFPTAVSAIVIGASTGGIEAIRYILQNLRANCPPVVIIQHISPQYAQSLISFLERETHLKHEATKFHTELRPGHFYMATGDYHLEFFMRLKRLELRKSYAEPQYGHRPSVDACFQSLAQTGDCTTLPIILTGMGRDGVEGISRLGKNGAFTIAQDEQSCVVFGMPKEAISTGNIKKICNLKALRNLLLNLEYLSPSTDQTNSKVS